MGVLGRAVRRWELCPTLAPASSTERGRCCDGERARISARIEYQERTPRSRSRRPDGGQRRQKYDVKIGDLLRAGYLQSGETLIGVYKGERYERRCSRMDVPVG